MNYKTLSLNQQVCLVQQASHDIRSPIMALNSIFHSQDSICPKKRILAMKALKRLQCIAEELLGTPTASKSEPNQICISTLIRDLIDEKQELSSDIELRFVNQLPHSLFLGLNQKNKLQRILSNLINNSIETNKNNAPSAVVVRLRYSSGMCRISVLDNGYGIPKHILHRIGERGFSYGKKNGHGLGLFDVMQTIESWNGFTEIRSELGVGTEVTLTFPVSS